jgi:hypothetical protein
MGAFREPTTLGVFIDTRKTLGMLMGEFREQEG